MHIKVAFILLTLAVVFTQAKPSLPFDFHGVGNYLDLAPPVLPPAHFHHAAPAPLLPHYAKFLPSAHFHATPLLPPPAPAPLLPAPIAAPAPLLPAPAPLLPAPAPLFPAPAPLLPAPAPLLPSPVAAPTHLLPAPAPLLPAPAPLVPAHVVHTHTQVIPAPTAILPPVYEPLPFVASPPTYRAIPGPKTTTHHVSLGYAFPHSRLANLHTHAVHGVSHGHLHAAPLSLAHHHHHHTLF